MINCRCSLSACADAPCLLVHSSIFRCSCFWLVVHILKFRGSCLLYMFRFWPISGVIAEVCNQSYNSGIFVHNFSWRDSQLKPQKNFGFFCDLIFLIYCCFFNRLLWAPYPLSEPKEFVLILTNCMLSVGGEKYFAGSAREKIFVGSERLVEIFPV